VHIKIMKYGYARVSTDGQSVEAQVRQLTKAGCKKVFRETASGAKTDRSQLRKALDQLLMVTRLDRLARSTRDLLNTLATITDRKAGFRSLGDTWADTTNAPPPRPWRPLSISTSTRSSLSSHRAATARLSPNEIRNAHNEIPLTEKAPYKFRP
jgi:hypothetical protein